jgi:hypothetical protein
MVLYHRSTMYYQLFKQPSHVKGECEEVCEFRRNIQDNIATGIPCYQTRHLFLLNFSISSELILGLSCRSDGLVFATRLSKLFLEASGFLATSSFFCFFLSELSTISMQPLPSGRLFLGVVLEALFPTCEMNFLRWRT